MTHKQQLKIKSFVIDTDNYLNGIFPAFNSLINEFSPRTRLIDTFSSHFSFYHANYKSKESKAAYIYKLDKYMFYAFNNSKLVVIVSNASIKNNITISIMHVHLLLDVVLTRLFKFLMSFVSSLLWIQFI